MPAILTGPMNKTQEYGEDLMATFTCTAFGGNDAEIVFVWYPQFVFFSTVESLNADGSITSTASSIIPFIHFMGNRTGLYSCCVYFHGSSIDQNCDTATISIGKISVFDFQKFFFVLCVLF